MKFATIALVFASTFAIGWTTAPSTAECRSCQQKRCSSDRSCGESCACVWPDGKDYKQGTCLRMDD